MKCRIPERQKIFNTKARDIIRRMVSDCSSLVFAEVWGWGTKRINEMRKDVEEIYKVYDAKYGRDTRRYLDDLMGRMIDEQYPIRPGSGSKVLVGREHDIAYLVHVYCLRQRGFGVNRITIYHDELQKRIRYYNKTFAEEPRVVVDVMENRLESRGVKLCADHSGVQRQ